MAGRPALRASDADRDAVAERLRRAAAEGRLLTDELEQRLEAALSARTYGQLDALVEDLPGSRGARRPRTHTVAWALSALALAIAIPAVLLAVAVVVLAVTGVVAMWWVWLVVGWWFFGARRSLYGRGHGRARHACRGARARQVRAQGPSRAFWI
jgi:DUF1707 SHOCT-like domain